jgi:NO-binding membrane sensor protein with MHYT domain
MTKTLIKVAVIALFAGTFATEGMATQKQSTSRASNSSTVVAIGVGTTYGVSGGAVLGNSNSKSSSKGGNSGAADGSAGGIAGGLGISGHHHTGMTAGFAAGGVTSSASTN